MYTFSSTINVWMSGSNTPLPVPYSDSKTYNAPSITGISPSYTTAGTSSVTVTITGGSLGADDLGNPPGTPSIYAGVNSVNVATSGGAASGISASFNPTPYNPQYNVTGVSLTATLNTTNATAGVYNVSVTALGSTSNTVQFTLADPSPVIFSVTPDEPLYAGGQAYVSIYGANFGDAAGSIQICTNSSGTCVPATDVSASLNALYAVWNNGQVNALFTFLTSSAGSTYYVQITASVDALGTGFLDPPQQPNGNQSTRMPLIPASFSISISQSTKLWFFGNGVTPPESFALGDTSSALTAAGPTGGTFNWQVTAGAAKASFSSNASQQAIATAVNNTVLYTTAGSTAANDVTVQVAWTDAHGNTFPSASISTTIDRPYSLAPNGPTAYFGVADPSLYHSGSRWLLHPDLL